MTPPRRTRTSSSAPETGSGSTPVQVPRATLAASPAASKASTLLGSFDTLHQLEADGRCRIVSAADKLQLVQRHPRIARREELDVAMAPHVVRMKEGRAPPLAALRGDGQDVSKLSALKKVAVALMERRSMLFHEATRLFIAERSGFLVRLNAALEADGFDEDCRFRVPSWSVRKDGGSLASWSNSRRPMSEFPKVATSAQPCTRVATFAHRFRISHKEGGRHVRAALGAFALGL